MSDKNYSPEVPDAYQLALNTITVVSQERDRLKARVKTLEDAIIAALVRDGCRCDTSICNWCKTNGWLQVSPDNVKQLKQALAAKEPK